MRAAEALSVILISKDHLECNVFVDIVGIYCARVAQIKPRKGNRSQF